MDDGELHLRYHLEAFLKSGVFFLLMRMRSCRVGCEGGRGGLARSRL